MTARGERALVARPPPPHPRWSIKLGGGGGRWRAARASGPASKPASGPGAPPLVSPSPAGRPRVWQQRGRHLPYAPRRIPPRPPSLAVPLPTDGVRRMCENRRAGRAGARNVMMSSQPSINERRERSAPPGRSAKVGRKVGRWGGGGEFKASATQKTHTHTHGHKRNAHAQRHAARV